MNQETKQWPDMADMDSSNSVCRRNLAVGICCGK